MSTQVGQAYIAITADGRNLNDDIADGFDDIDVIGDRAGKKFQRAFSKHLESINKDFDKVLGRLGTAIDNDKNIERSINSMLADAMTNGSLDRLYEETARRAGVKWGGEFDDIVRKRVANTLQRALRDAARNGETIDITSLLKVKSGAPILGAVFDDITRKVSAEIKTIEAERIRSSERAAAEEKRITEKAAREWVKGVRAGHEENARIVQKAMENRIRLQEASNRAILTSDEQLVRQQEKLFADLQKAAIKADEEKWKQRRLSAQAHIKYLADLERGRIDERANPVQRGSGEPDFADKISARLGKGSRNDFIHYFGTMSGAGVKAIAKVMRAGDEMFGAFRVGWKSAEQGASLATKAMAGFANTGALAAAAGSRAMAALAKSGPIAVIAVGVVTLALTALASIASALVGIVAALASTIVSGLVAALAVAGGAILAVVAAGGLLTAGFMALDKAQKNVLKTSFAPLKADLNDLGSLVAKGMVPSFKAWASNLRDAIKMMQPLAKVSGNAFGEAGRIMTESFSGPGYRQMVASLEVHLPNIVRNLSLAFSGFGNGVMGLFAAIMPYVEDFSSYLSDVAGRFAAWATSAQGKNSIADFMDRAVVSLKSFWGFLREVGGLLSDVLFGMSAQTTGNSMFDSMAASVGRLRDAAANGGLERWMADVEKFASSLGTAISGLAAVFDALNNSGVLGAIAAGLTLIGEAAQTVAPAMDAAVTAATNLSKFSGAGAIARQAGLGLKFFGDRAEGSSESVKKVEKAAAEMTSLERLRETNLNLAWSYDQITGAATSATRATLLKELADSDMLATANQLGISSKTVVDALLGEADAAARVNAAINGAREGADRWTESGNAQYTAANKLANEFGLMTAKTAEQRAAAEANIIANRGWLGSLQGLPKEVKVQIREEGLTGTMAGIEKLVSKNPNLNRRQIKILGDASGIKLTKKQVDTLLGQLDTKTAKPKIDLQGVSGSVTGARKVDRELGNLPKNVKPKVQFGGVEETVRGAGRVEKNLKTVDRTRVTLRGWLGGIKTAIDSGARFSNREARAIMEKLEAIEKANPNMRPYVTDVRRAVNDAKGEASKSSEVGNQLKQGLLNGMYGTGAALSAIMATAVRDAIRAAKREAASKSPSRKTMALGRDLGAGLRIGMDESAAEVEAAGARMAAAALRGSEKGAKGKKGKKDGGFKRPKNLKKWARSLIDNGPSLAEQVTESRRAMFAQLRDAVTAASSADSAESVSSGLASMRESVLSDAESMVSSAQDAVNNAAQRLLNAKKKGAIEKAFKATRAAQRQLKRAEANQKRIRKTLKSLEAQEVVNPDNVEKLLAGVKVRTATLADYATARVEVAKRIADANQKLAEAISMRDTFRQAVTDGAKSFAALTTATGQIVNGIEQQVTAADITSNLSSRLEKIQKFQSDLQILLSSGLSNEAYKQILDAGVENGGAFADALVRGGAGAIADTNNLLNEIAAVSDSLGLEASNRLYQAGVDAAQGLVDGLTSLSEELDSAAAALGESIAAAIRRSLGIQSPSRVAMSLMDFVGDGAVIGLDNQTNKVSSAAESLGALMAPSPEALRFEATRRAMVAPVSGNGQLVGDITIITPTDDPEAVAKETVNELTGRFR